MGDLVVLVPMLGRASLVDVLQRSLEESTDRGRILWLCSQGDLEVLAATDGQPRIVLPARASGDYAHKMNVGVLNSTEPLIFLGAIDIRFRHGWLEACEAHLSDQIRVVGTNDHANPRTAKGHSTHTLVCRDYTERGLIDGRPGLICEDYVHEFTDDELVGTAQARGAYIHDPEVIVEHLHPMTGKTPWDASYRAQRERMAQSRAVYLRRRKLWT